MPSKILIAGEAHEQLTNLLNVFSEVYDVVHADTECTAMTQIQAEDIRVVLMGTQLKGTSGLTLLKHIRQIPQYKTLPIILLAAHNDPETTINGLKMGANDYIPEPIDTELALARIEAQIDMKEALDARDAEIKKLKDQNAAQERLVRMVTHDLKHPLANIIMAEGLIRHYMAQSTQGAEVVDSVHMALDSIQEVLEDFSDAFWLNQDARISTEPVHLARVLNDVAIEYIVSATNKNMTLDVHSSDATVMADRPRLKRVIGNLLSNAIKYSPPGSQIRVLTRQHGDHMRITVCDQGPGIRKEEAHRLFTEFGRLSTRPTGQETSTGLGLWIVRMLVEAMDGKVGYENSPKCGAAFWVELPVIHTIEISAISPSDTVEIPVLHKMSV